MSEAHEQAAVIEWAERMSGRYPPLARLCHVPNGGRRDPREALSLKRQGVKKGVPDLQMLYPAGGYHGLLIEMKYGSGKLSPEQKDWIAYLDGAGYKIAVCYSAEEAIGVITDYLKGGQK